MTTDIFDLPQYIRRKIKDFEDAITLSTGNHQFDNGYNLAAVHAIKHLKNVLEKAEELQQISDIQEFEYHQEVLPGNFNDDYIPF